MLVIGKHMQGGGLERCWLFYCLGGGDLGFTRGFKGILSVSPSMVWVPIGQGIVIPSFNVVAHVCNSYCNFMVLFCVMLYGHV